MTKPASRGAEPHSRTFRARTVRTLASIAIAASILSATGCGDGNHASSSRIEQETFDIPSQAHPADTPGTAGVGVVSPKLLAQFGGSSFTLNQRTPRSKLARAATRARSVSPGSHWLKGSGTAGRAPSAGSGAAPSGA